MHYYKCVDWLNVNYFRRQYSEFTHTASKWWICM